MKSANLLAGQQVRRPADKMTSALADTPAPVAALFCPKKARAARVSELVTPKKDPPAVTLTCPTCGRSVTLAVIGTAHCLPCRRAMRQGEGGKPEKPAQHATNPAPARPKQGSSAPVRRRREWHAHP